MKHTQRTMIRSTQTESELITVAENITVQSSKSKPEFLALHMLPESSNDCTIEAKNLPHFATKNNILKMNWWHSPTQPTNMHFNEVVNICNNNNSHKTDGGQEDVPNKIPLNSTVQNIIQLDKYSELNPEPGLAPEPASKIELEVEPNRQSICTSKKRIRSAQSVFGSKNSFVTFEPNDEYNTGSQDSQLLVNDPKPCVGLLNSNEEDEMQITGYRRSRCRTFACWFCIILSVGLLRLVLHWWRHWYLLATHKPCPLQVAEKVLIQEAYQGKHKLYHIKSVKTIDIANLREYLEKLKQKNGPNLHDLSNLDECNLHLSVHFSGTHFRSSKSLRIIRCKQLIYAWDNQTYSFNKINGLDHNVPCAYFHQQSGLNIQEQLARSFVYGPNEITIPYRDIKTLLFLEVLNPFYVFQIFSVVLWFSYDYYYYACVILIMSIFGITMSTIQTKKNQDVLRATVLNTGCALVANVKGEVSEVPTQTLVPGDIIEIPSTGCIMQCDAILLSGNCILDESMLTGESVPVTKTPLPMKRDVIFDKKEHARHTLFCGTKVIQTRYIGSKKVLAFVINTGNITAKGGLIRSILYPPPVDYKFEQDSYKFIQCLALIACIGFIYTLVSKILRGTDPVKIAIESLDLITIVVPPALPAAMTVGRFYAQKRLKLDDIYCISPRSINVAGSIDCCCFDKTGTLTEDGLDMWAVVPKSSTNQFQIPLKQIERLPLDHFLFGMVTCHSITVMNGKMMGDPLDLKMFESTGWLLEDSKNVPENEKYGLIYPTILRQPKKANNGGHTSPTVQRQSSVDDLLANVGLSNNETNYDHGIVREFPFTSSLQRMSVITSCLGQQGFNIYCKGSPEMLQQLCKPETLPDNYTQQLSVYAKKGYRIIALAYKSLGTKINYTKVQRLSREDIEHELEFLGFVILENRLKPDTTTVINSLNSANIRTIMVTGDNILTAMSVARDCGIVSPSQAIITVHATHEENLAHGVVPKYELQYTLDLGSKSCTDAPASVINGHGVLNNSTKFNNYALNNGDILSLNSFGTSSLQNSASLTSVKTCDTWTHNEVDVELGTSISKEEAVKIVNDANRMNWRKNYRFAMDGKTWQIVRDHFPEQMAILLTRGVIYARMSPEQKQALIIELQKIDYCVSMCGDGANDCGALKVAHTGISLSETESSIASPFTSRKSTIAAVPNVIKEGRAALVTSFGIFKYMAAYSLVQFISVMILYSIDSNLTDKQYLYVDLGLISIFAFFFGKTEAYTGKLAKQVPLSSLVSPTPLTSLILHLLVVIAFQVAGWFQLHQQPWFVPFQHADEDHLGCFENYTMFAISSFQYIILAFIFSKGAPYRRPIWSNWPLCLTFIVNLTVVIYLVVYPSEWAAEFFQLIVPHEMGFRYVMLAYGLLSFVTHVIVESIVVEYFIFKKIQIRCEQQPSTSKRTYMRLEQNLQAYENWPPISEVYDPHETSNFEDTEPTYVNLGAEQNSEMPKDTVFPGFFEVDNSLNRHMTAVNMKANAIS